MNSRHFLLSAVALALAHWGAPALAGGTAGDANANGIEPIDDAELATMRGRYTIDDNTVAWFGVQMISTWQDANGRTLQAAMSVAMDFSHDPGRPQVSFVPTVSIVQAAASPQTTADATGPARSADGSGLANVAGLVQSVQIAGDDNGAGNTTRLTVQDGGSAQATIASDAGPRNGTGASTRSGDATATASYSGNAAQVLLTIAGQGAVQQWIRNGSLGQSVTLTADHQSASNLMEITLIRQALAANTQVGLDVAQSIQSARGLAR
jgi:hypothetical protein